MTNTVGSSHIKPVHHPICSMNFLSNPSLQIHHPFTTQGSEVTNNRSNSFISDRGRSYKGLPQVAMFRM